MCYPTRDPVSTDASDESASRARDAALRSLEEAERRPEAGEGLASRAFAQVLKGLSDADAEAAARRVRALRERHPNLGPEELAERLIGRACKRTAAVGAVSSGAALLPGIGTLTALTAGLAADLAATFKLQAELVLEIAAAFEAPLSSLDEQKLILLVTGVSTGSNALLNRASQQVTARLGARLAGRGALKALPVVGLVASSGTNALATYVIGRRAVAYFDRGPEALTSWKDSLRALSGVDERKLGSWLADSGRGAASALGEGAGSVGAAVLRAGRATAGLVGDGAGAVKRAALGTRKLLDRRGEADEEAAGDGEAPQGDDP